MFTTYIYKLHFFRRYHCCVRVRNKDLKMVSSIFPEAKQRETNETNERSEWANQMGFGVKHSPIFFNFFFSSYNMSTRWILFFFAIYRFRVGFFFQAMINFFKNAFFLSGRLGKNNKIKLKKVGKNSFHMEPRIHTKPLFFL